MGLLNVFICVTMVTHLLVQNEGKETQQSKGHPEQASRDTSVLGTRPIQIPIPLE